MVDSVFPGVGVTAVVAKVEQGLPGPPGPPGVGSTGSGTVGASNISSDMAIVLVSGLLVPADPTNIVHAGLPIYIATQAGTSGATITYAAAGDLAGGAWVVGTRYYAGLNGFLSTTARAVGAVWAKSIGVGKTSGIIAVQMGPTIRIN